MKKILYMLALTLLVSCTACQKEECNSILRVTYVDSENIEETSENPDEPKGLYFNPPSQVGEALESYLTFRDQKMINLQTDPEISLQEGGSDFYYFSKKEEAEAFWGQISKACFTDLEEKVQWNRFFVSKGFCLSCIDEEYSDENYQVVVTVPNALLYLNEEEKSFWDRTLKAGYTLDRVERGPVGSRLFISSEGYSKQNPWVNKIQLDLRGGKVHRLILYAGQIKKGAKEIVSERQEESLTAILGQISGDLAESQNFVRNLSVEGPAKVSLGKAQILRRKYRNYNTEYMVDVCGNETKSFYVYTITGQEVEG